MHSSQARKKVNSRVTSILTYKVPLRYTKSVRVWNETKFRILCTRWNQGIIHGKKAGIRDGRNGVIGLSECETIRILVSFPVILSDTTDTDKFRLVISPKTCATACGVIVRNSYNRIRLFLGNLGTNNVCLMLFEYLEIYSNNQQRIDSYSCCVLI